MLHVLLASTERDLDGAFATLIERRAGGLQHVSTGVNRDSQGSREVRV
jgi:hypothetical protein